MLLPGDGGNESDSQCQKDNESQLVVVVIELRPCSPHGTGERPWKLRPNHLHPSTGELLDEFLGGKLTSSEVIPLLLDLML